MQGKTPVLLLAVLYAGAFLAGFNENLVNMALMSIMGEYAVDSVTAQWLVTGYMIVATVVVMCMAFLYRRFPLRTLFFAAVAFSLVGSAMGLFAGSFAFLMAARVVQAVGSGLFIPLMLNTVVAIVPKNKLGTYISVGGCMITFGPAFAPVVCGALVTAFGWHSIFVVPVAGMVVLAVLGAVAVKNLRTTEAYLDAPSVVLATVFLMALSFGLVELILLPIVAAVSLVVAVGAAVLFVLRQLRCPHPLIDLVPMKSSAFWPSIVLTTIAMMGSFSCSVLLPLYFEGGAGVSAFMAGIILLVPVLANAGATLVAGRLFDAHGEWPLLPVGFAVIAVGFVLMAALASTLSLPLMFVAALLVYGGTGLIFSPSQTAGLRTLPPAQNPFGVALSTTFVQVAACVGPSLYTGLLTTGQGSALAAGAGAGSAMAQGFSLAVTVAAVIAAVGVLLSLWYARAAVKRDASARAAREQAAGTRVARAAVSKRGADAASVADGASAREGVSGGRTAAAHPVPAESLSLAAIMEPHPYTLPANAPVRDAMRLFVDRRVGGVPLVDAAGMPAGFVSDGDVMRYLADRQPALGSMYALMEAVNTQTFDGRLRELLTLPVGTIATSKLVSLDAGASLKDACNLLATHKLKKVPVVHNGRIVGTVNRSDIIRHAMEGVLGS